jgi:hypothetical protein
LTESFAFKSSPYICYTNLCSLEKPYTFPVLETYDIIEAGEIIGENVDQSRSGIAGFCYAVCKAALVLLHPIISDLTRRCKQGWSYLVQDLSCFSQTGHPLLK